MYKKIIFPFIISVLITFSACTRATSSHELAVCGSYAVPGMFCTELKGGTYSCSILESDMQGRILFEYVTESTITHNEETALVICQAVDEQYVYFYEDQCYLLNEYDENDIIALKEQNDWSQPLKENKMSRRSKNISFDLFIISDSVIERKKLLESCSRKLDIDESQIELNMLDIDPTGLELYLLQTELYGMEKTYFVISDLSYQVDFLEISDNSYSVEELIAFKQDNKWTYGYYVS